MPIHDWTRVIAGTYHDFHSAWITHLKETLNAGLLPEGYYALAEQQARQIQTDVLTLYSGNGAPLARLETGPVAVAEAPPKVTLRMVPDEAATYRLSRRTLTIRHASNHRIVALLEIVSPSNKDRALSVEQFVDKAIAAINQGCHLLILDLLPPGRFDPNGIHGAIWENFDLAGYSVPADRPLTLAAYAVDKLPDAYVEPTAVGRLLSDMPLFVQPDRYVNVPLEATYESAYRGVPEYWRKVIEGR